MDFCSDSLKMNLLKHYLLMLLYFVISINLFSLERVLNVTEILIEFDSKLEGAVIEEYDSNNDGNIDYFVRINYDGDKIMESMDFNHDGQMDDLYFYSNGIIVRREVDSNFDSNIDIWVYIKDGSLIEKYEQDLDFNGDIDKIKIFGGEDKS
jgi:hypothetical protein